MASPFPTTSSWRTLVTNVTTWPVPMLSDAAVHRNGFFRTVARLHDMKHHEASWSIYNPGSQTLTLLKWTSTAMFHCTKQHPGESQFLAHQEYKKFQEEAAKRDHRSRNFEWLFAGVSFVYDLDLCLITSCYLHVHLKCITHLFL